MLDLFNTSLVTKDPDNGTIHVHRLVQARVRDIMEADKRYEYFLPTTTLLLEAFPKHGKGRSLRNEFVTCKVIHHSRHGTARSFEGVPICLKEVRRF